MTSSGNGSQRACTSPAPYPSPSRSVKYHPLARGSAKSGLSSMKPLQSLSRRSQPSTAPGWIVAAESLQSVESTT